MKRVIVYTDGGCHGNPGPGGWAAILRFGSHVRLLSGAELATTNNRMELVSAIAALSALKEPCQVDLHTDSQYLRQGITKWLRLWKHNNWQTAERQPVKNKDLWCQLDAAQQRHRVTWHWVKGHAGHADNEQCDRAAAEALSKLRSEYTALELAEALQAFLVAQKNPNGQTKLF